LTRQLAAITGASSGIGEVFARKLAPSYDLLLVARRIDRLEAMAMELRNKYAAAVHVFAADLSDEQQLAACAERIASEQNLALLVNNAGFGTRGLFWQAAIEREAQMHRLNVLAVLRLSHAALRNMVPRKSGAIINVASVAGFVRRTGTAGYSSTKAWVVAFTEALHLEMQSIRSPVKVQALCPGLTYSEFHDEMKIDRMKLGSPALWLRADFVVDESLRALVSGRLFVIPGWRYKAIVNLISILPLPLRLLLEARLSGKR
jgi:short-subunit dehydrogenase